MGCLKLSYYQTYSNRKVLYSDSVLEPKSAQMWLSVDPMSDKYPSMSPYNYCANNPMKLIDPNGMEIDEAAGPKDPPNSLHPNRDTFFDPKDDNQRNTQSSPQSGSKSTNNNNQSGNTDNSNTSSSTSNSNSQNSSQSDNNQGKQSPAHSITIGGVACIYGGVSLDIGVIWDKKDVAFFICGGVCSGYDLSLGGQYTRYNNMKSAEGKGDVLEVGLLFLNYAHLPRAGNGVGASTSPSFSVTGRKTYSMILKPDIKSYGETISIFGHTTR